MKDRRGQYFKKKHYKGKFAVRIKDRHNPDKIWYVFSDDKYSCTVVQVMWRKVTGEVSSAYLKCYSAILGLDLKEALNGRS